MIGKVQMNNLNLKQGPLPSVENYLLFVGRGANTNENKLLTVNAQTDLDTILGSADSVLKKQVKAAQLNGKQNWNACVVPLDGVMTWAEGVDFAMENTSVEGFVVTDPVENAAGVESMQAKCESIMSTYMRPMHFIATTRGIDNTPDTGETWADYVTAIKPITNAIAADVGEVVPTLWGMDQGTLGGRLCDQSVTVADSPMRVETGSLLGEWSTKPTDKNGTPLSMAVLADLERARFSVPQWYSDYPGVYWADGNVLDVPGGDYQVIENVRVIHKAMRKIYPLAVARIANRILNSTPQSIAYNSSYFMRPLRQMSKSVEINGITFPGEIHPPKDGDIVISWESKYEVQIYLSAQPYNSPKKITANLMLDLKNYD